MYVLKSTTVSDRYAEDGAHNDDVPAREALRNGTSEQPQTVIYLDPRAFTRDCVGQLAKEQPQRLPGSRLAGSGRARGHSRR